jgi:fructose-bisphosphate aldolase / 2-amino-3,7-dideoxy-D-threo-hept-6-ulosonate synthase
VSLLAPDGRLLVVALDHGLYSWPNPGLEDRRAVIEMAVANGADALITSYGTLRDHRDAFGDAKPILKLDLTTLSIGPYEDAPYRVVWTVEDAVRLGAAAVLTYVQVGPSYELDDLGAAAQVAAAADRASIPYVCEIMPSDTVAPTAVSAVTRAAAELGAHLVKTCLPDPPAGIADSCGHGVPVIVAGGAHASERDALFAAVQDCLDAGAAGVAFGRNVWGAGDPAGTVRRLRELVHG